MFGRFKNSNFFVYILSRRKKLVLLFSLLLILTPLLSAWLNIYLQEIINMAVQGAYKIVIMRMILIGFIVWMLKRFTEYTTDLVRADLLCETKRDLRTDLFHSVFSKPAEAVLSYAEHGEYVSDFLNNFNVLEQRYLRQMISLPGNLISALILTIAFFRLNVKLAALALSFGCVTVMIPVIFTGLLNKKNSLYLEKISLLTKKIKEYFSGFMTIRNHHTEVTAKAKFDEVNSEAESAMFDSESMMILANHTSDLIIWFMQFVVLGLGLVLTASGEMLVGTVIAARAFARDIAIPVKSAIQNINSIYSAREMNRNFMQNIYPDEMEKQSKHPDLQDYRIAFDNVYCEVNGTPILNGIRCTFEPGKKYLITGPNGAGKTTMFFLLKRYMRYTSGSIRIGGVCIDEIPEADLSAIVSYIPERTSIFSESVRDNISLFVDYPDDMIRQAMEQAQLDIPPDKILINAGENISTGEKRKIEIARSLLRKVPVIVFDETLSSLDSDSAYRIEDMLLHYNHTVIMISHVFSEKTIRQYDEIITVENGRITSKGDFDTVFRENEFFRNMCLNRFGNRTG